jgi:UDP-N-acetylmuramate dehydrogenase
MNAGAYGGQMADVLVESRYYDPAQDRVVTLTAEEHAFSYRHSVYLDHPERTVLSAVFALQPGDRDALAAEMQELMQRRRDKQPMEYPSAGSTFKRPEGYFAGALIEQCGLKGFSVGGAQVSEKHAGFLINRGGATADDMRRLMEHVQRCVLARTGVRLEPEVQYVESGDEV